MNIPQKIFSRIDTCQNVDLAKRTFFQKLSFQNLHLSEFTFGRNHISPKAYFPEIAFSETIFHSKNYTMFRILVSNKQNKLLVKVKNLDNNN